MRTIVTTVAISYFTLSRIMNYIVWYYVLFTFATAMKIAKLSSKYVLQYKTKDVVMLFH